MFLGQSRRVPSSFCIARETESSGCNGTLTQMNDLIERFSVRVGTDLASRLVDNWRDGMVFSEVVDYLIGQFRL
jgi:hypothetical protein